MAYQYYQNACSGWGQRSVRLGVPPIPNIRPQSDWNGGDYYSAHGINANPATFYNLMDRVRDLRGRGGYEHSEAKDWHRRIYGGLTDLTRALPVDIGAAAAYEAYRMWKHHRRTLGEYLSQDKEREIEALVGLAAAEASHLWQFTGRPMDQYGVREALESASLTGYQLAHRLIDDNRGIRSFFSGGASSRRSSVSSGMVDDDYSRGYHRHRRHSSLGTTPPIMIGRGSSNGGYGTPYSNAIPIPGQGTPYASSIPIGQGSPYSNPIGIPGQGTPYSNPIAIPAQGSAYGGVASSSYGNAGLPGSYGGSNYQRGGMAGSYGGATVIPGGGAYGGQPQYAGSGYGQGQAYTIQGSQYPGGAMTLPSVPPGSTIIIQQPSRRSRHGSMSSHKRHHSHHRSMSSDPNKRVAFI